MIWVYKCNSKNRPYQVAYGDWQKFFETGRIDKWGSTEWTPALAEAKKGDTIIAYQTDRNELVGIARVVEHKARGRYQDLMLKPVEMIGVKVRPLKNADPKVAVIPALQPGPIRTLYAISGTDARRLLKKAGAKSYADLLGGKLRLSPPNKGGGFGSPDQNKETEDAAISFVISYLTSRGWAVQNIGSENRGYDLICTRNGRRIDVEVKGVGGSKSQFLITANERKQWAMNSRFVLALVNNARGVSPSLSLFKGPAAIKRFVFRPVSFMATAEN